MFNSVSTVDSWSMGLIIAEMIAGVPMAPGDSEIDQLFKFFRFFGTPTADTWPGCASLPHWQKQIPNFPPVELRSVLPRGNPQLLEIISKLCVYPTNQRLKASAALDMPYFDSLNKGKKRLSPLDMMMSPDMRKLGRRISSSVTVSPPDSAQLTKRSAHRNISPTYNVMNGPAALQAVQDRSHGLLKRSMSTIGMDQDV